MNVMCGIDFVTPFQGLNMFDERCSQGVALGCHVIALLARDNWRVKSATSGKAGGLR
jgi:hypothetical protein